MKKKILLVLALVFVIGLTGCASNKNKDAALNFKKDYESLNGVKNKRGIEHRTVIIDEDNPFVEITTEELLKKIEKKETFYVYFGDKLCPWCRSVIEKAIEVAKKKGIKKIYYVAIWDDEGNEIVRDKYTLEDGELVKTIKGCKEYASFLKTFDKLLSEYNLKDEDGNQVSTGEKRIYAPNFIYVEKGEAIRITEGVSSLQEESRQELTEEILKEEEELFEEFFK